MIIFSSHSLAKLKQRNLKKELVIETLTDPDSTKPSHGDRTIAFKKFGKLYLKVVFRKEGANIIVITQHWIDKLSN